VRSYAGGLFVLAGGLLASGLAPVYALAVPAFGLVGFGNGAVLVYERLLIQATVPDDLSGRVFGIKDALTAWAFGLAFLIAGAATNALGVRLMLVLAGGLGLLVALLAGRALQRSFGDLSGRVELSRASGDGSAGEDGADLVDRRKDRPTTLDHPRQGTHDAGIELGPGVGG
jgi:MFS family permease